MTLRFLAGAAAGYVLGARAGRERYDQIVSALGAVTESDLFVQVRSEFSRLAGGLSTNDAGLVAPPVIVGPGPEGATGSANTDVVLPDLESSSSSSVAADVPAVAADEGPARRLDPPKKSS